MLLMEKLKINLQAEVEKIEKFISTQLDERCQVISNTILGMERLKINLRK